MEIYKNPFVSRESYLVKTGKAYSHPMEATKSEGYQVQLWDGKWDVKKAQYYDSSLRAAMQIIAENNVSIQDVIEKVILMAVIDLLQSQEKEGVNDG